MKLVEDWRKAWKWISVQVMAVLAVMPIVWMQLPPDIKSKVPAEWLPWIVAAVAIGGIIGRLKDQK